MGAGVGTGVGGGGVTPGGVGVGAVDGPGEALAGGWLWPGELGAGEELGGGVCPGSRETAGSEVPGDASDDAPGEPLPTATPPLPPCDAPAELGGEPEADGVPLETTTATRTTVARAPPAASVPSVLFARANRLPQLVNAPPAAANARSAAGRRRSPFRGSGGMMTVRTAGPVGVAFAIRPR